MAEVRVVLRLGRVGYAGSLRWITEYLVREASDAFAFDGDAGLGKRSSRGRFFWCMMAMVMTCMTYSVGLSAALCRVYACATCVFVSWYANLVSPQFTQHTVVVPEDLICHEKSQAQENESLGQRLISFNFSLSSKAGGRQVYAYGDIGNFCSRYPVFGLAQDSRYICHLILATTPTHQLPWIPRSKRCGRTFNQCKRFLVLDMSPIWPSPIVV